MVKAAKLISRLAVVDENILYENAMMPMLFVDAARYRVQKMRERSEIELTLETYVAMYGLQVRRTAVKATEGYIKSRIHRRKKYKALSLALIQAQAREEFSKLLIQAYHMRKTGLEIIANAQRAEGAKGAAQIERKNWHRKLEVEASKLYLRRARLRGE